MAALSWALFLNDTGAERHGGIEKIVLHHVSGGVTPVWSTRQEQSTPELTMNPTPRSLSLNGSRPVSVASSRHHTTTTRAGGQTSPW